MLEKLKLLNLSTAHLSEDTMDELFHASQDEYYNTYISVPVFAKGNYGFFVYITNSPELSDLPSDLADAIEFANAEMVDIICFDPDVQPIPELKEYPH